MLRIDFYVQHLLRHNADAIEIVSGSPVKFRFPNGERQSNSAIEHGHVVQLVHEAASPEALEQLRANGKMRFRHASAAGVDVAVVVEVRSAEEWRVVVSPVGREATFHEAPPLSSEPDPQTEEDIAAVRARAARPSMPPRTPVVDVASNEPKLNRFLRMMVKLGASDLHLSSGVAPMVRLHGEMLPLEGQVAIAAEQMSELVREIMPPRNRAELDQTSDTDFAHTIDGVARFRANVFVDRRGPGAVFRVIPFSILTPEQLGVPKQVLDLCWLSKGLVLVTGPTGSGKSTTLATLIDFINRNRADHIITIEDPIEFVHDNKKCLVNQREVGTHTSGFKRALRAALREDPDIVLVGEMRDLETIAIAIETAETGHLVFGTLHTTSATSTVDRIIDQFPPEQQAQIRVMLSESLRGVIAQVLCKKKGGGRVAAYEVLIANPAAANLIREGKTFQLASVMQTGKNLGMQTMNEHLLAHVKAGLVEPEEAYIKSNDKLQMKDALARAGITLRL